MEANDSNRYIAFSGNRRVARGAPIEVALAAKQLIDADRTTVVSVFDEVTSRVIELDLRGSVEEVKERYQTQVKSPGGEGSAPVRRRGRPKLGVVGREVTLLPRHWHWLNSQRGGASVTLRKLVDQARRENAAADQQRRGQDSAFKFMSAMAGDLPGFEEAIRALFSVDRSSFELHTKSWPEDLRLHIGKLVESVFEIS